MDLFIKEFKKIVPLAYPWQGEGFLPKLGLCGTLNDGIFNSDDVSIEDKIGIKTVTETDHRPPDIKEFSSLKNIQWVSELGAEGKSIVKSIKIKGKFLFMPLNFNSVGEFYYRAIHLNRDYIYAPKQILESPIKMALKDGKWRKNDVVITAILYGKNPVTLKTTEKGTSIIIGGNISGGLRDSDINFKIEFIHSNKSISTRHIIDPNEEVIVGFEMMGLKGYLSKRLEKYKGEHTDNSYDIFKDIYDDFPENEPYMEYMLDYV
ncbi:MAG: hypothetical protein LBH60_07265 [Prevotellaceae bacterium]|jgi:hypothetical protein|nr:hypothetical protein [Prevotellaceae bacterium]